MQHGKTRLRLCVLIAMALASSTKLTNLREFDLSSPFSPVYLSLSLLVFKCNFYMIEFTSMHKDLSCSL